MWRAHQMGVVDRFIVRVVPDKSGSAPEPEPEPLQHGLGQPTLSLDWRLLLELVERAGGSASKSSSAPPSYRKVRARSHRQREPTMPRGLLSSGPAVPCACCLRTCLHPTPWHSQHVACALTSPCLCSHSMLAQLTKSSAAMTKASRASSFSRMLRAFRLCRPTLTVLVRTGLRARYAMELTDAFRRRLPRLWYPHPAPHTAPAPFGRPRRAVHAHKHAHNTAHCLQQHCLGTLRGPCAASAIGSLWRWCLQTSATTTARCRLSTSSGVGCAARSKAATWTPSLVPSAPSHPGARARAIAARAYGDGERRQATDLALRPRASCVPPCAASVRTPAQPPAPLAFALAVLPASSQPYFSPAIRSLLSPQSEARPPPHNRGGPARERAGSTDAQRKVTPG